jgi:hypothetical protein
VLRCGCPTAHSSSVSQWLTAPGTSSNGTRLAVSAFSGPDHKAEGFRGLEVDDEALAGPPIRTRVCCCHLA